MKVQIDDIFIIIATINNIDRSSNSSSLIIFLAWESNILFFFF